jgi:hypothetical protein
VFTSSGTYQPSPGLLSLVVECIGAGAGAGGTGEPAAQELFGGGGGGSGGYSRKTLPASLVAGGVVVTVGAGGGGVGAIGTGGDGNTTSFGALCVAYGGQGGGAMYPGIGAPQAGAGAIPGVGDLAFPGACGQPGYWQVFAAAGNSFSCPTPTGGQIFGGNQVTAVGEGSAFTGQNGLPNTGAGGSGGVSNQVVGSNVAGGNGGSGICIVTEFLSGAVGGGWGQTLNVAARGFGDWG